MWAQHIEYLKDPYLVAKIQKFFGVEIHYNEKSEAGKKKLERKDSANINKKGEETKNDVDTVKTDFNGCLRKESSTCELSFNEEESAKKEIAKEKNYSPSDEEIISTSDSEPKRYTIKNYFWYYLFRFGTELGDEIFYISFIPFWFWNVDCAVGRRVILIWATIMTIGQALKDVLCWPRPACPPVIRLQSKWSQEYGMPSTHAMVGVSIPFGVILFTKNRYIYPFPVGCFIATMWCTLVCMSRLYLGMHTVLDLIVGLTLAISLMIPLVPIIDATDYYLSTNVWALSILIAITIIAVIYYPCSDIWTPTRGDTTMVVSVTAGLHAGFWLNFITGVSSVPSEPPPYNIIWPSYPMLSHTVLRTILGVCCVIATKAILKSLSYTIMCAILRINSKELIKSENSWENKNKVLVELVYKYVTCFAVGVCIVYVLPNVFSMIGIERPSFYTEM